MRLCSETRLCIARPWHHTGTDRGLSSSNLVRQVESSRVDMCEEAGWSFGIWRGPFER